VSGEIQRPSPKNQEYDKMAVSLTISETLDGAQVADALAGGGTGTDLGQVTNGSFAPITPPAANNQGGQDWFIRHDATVDPITDVKFFIQEYGVGTGFTYGGPGTRSAAADQTTLKSLANASGGNKTNGDGLSGGLWLEQEVVTMISETNQFDQSGRPTFVKIFGDGLTDGVDLASAFVMAAEAAVINSDQAQGGDATDGFIPTAPVAGEIGKDTDAAKGDNGHVRFRIYTPSSFSDGGIFQTEVVVAYTFTA
jgi:hypothetical protein